MEMYRELSKILTTTFLKHLGKNKSLNLLYKLSKNHKFIEDVLSTSNYWQLFDKTYETLSKNYRCEYVYKSEIYSKIEKKIPENESSVLAEVRADESIADLVWLNGSSIAFEIKTEIDTNQRLSQQIESYSKLFEKTCVVTYEENVKNVIDLIPEYTGVYTLNNQNNLGVIREPLVYTKKLNHIAMFNTLRKKEYEQIIKKAYGYLPDVPNTMIYETCLKLFQEIDIIQAHNYMTDVLKKRSYKIKSKSFEHPESIKLLIDFGNFKKQELDDVKQLLV